MLFDELFAPSPLPLLHRAHYLIVGGAGFLLACAFRLRSRERHPAKTIER
jgi:hypothetical protein